MKLKSWGRILFFIVLVVLAGCKVGQEEVVLPTPTIAPEEIGEEDFIKATLVLDFGEGEVREFRGIETREKTAFGLLNKAVEEGNLDLDSEETDFGVFIKKIGEKENSQDLFWQFWVNGQFADKAADKLEIKDGDLVEWKYTKSQF